MLSADGLLILQATNCNHQVPAKLYEYLRARRPILALTDSDGDTAATLRQAGVDSIAPLDQKDAIIDALPRFLDQVRKGTAPLASAAVIAAHSRRARTEQLAQLLDQQRGSQGGALLAVVAAASLALPAHAARKEPYCGNLDNAYGPYDYRKGATELAFNLRLVESAHFTADVENGIKGKSSTLAGDLDYTLRAFPNHAVALSTVIRVASRDRKSLFLPHGSRPVECYFDRAVRFAPDDPSTHTLYGSYLLSVGRDAEALPKYQTAVQLDPDNPSTNYNMGLVYYKNKDMVNANKYAQIAYALEFPLPGLKNLLVQAGKWDTSAAPAPESLKKKAKGQEPAEAEEAMASPAPEPGKADAQGPAAAAAATAPAAAAATPAAPAAPGAAQPAQASITCVMSAERPGTRSCIHSMANISSASASPPLTAIAWWRAGGDTCRASQAIAMK
eukprot:gene43100-53496_t